MSDAQLSPEMEALKGRMKSTWEAGDFGVIARALIDGSNDLVRRVGVGPGMKVLDVACGTGNTALPAARLGADVIGVDIAENLIEQAKANAAAEGLDARFEVGDAEALAFDDDSFDAIITQFGAMFAPRPEVVVSEFVRVVKPGGLIAMGNWTPSGFTGQMFKIGAKHVPPPPGIPAPVLWGDEETVRQRFANGVADLKMERVKIMFHFDMSPADVVEHFRKYFGPTNVGFSKLDEAGQDAFRKDLVDLWTSANQAIDGTTAVESEYLLVQARKA